MIKYASISLLTLILSQASQLMAIDIQCNEHQSRCVTQDKDLVVGDRVGVFNKYNELVAVGKVKTMEGAKRSFKVYKNYGTIYQGYKVSLLDSDINQISQVEERYSLYRPHADYNYGASLGIASLAVGEYLSGVEFSGYGQRKSDNKMLDYVLRASITKANGKISRDDLALGVEEKDLGLIGLSIMPGISTTLLEQNLVSLRGEVDGGFVWISSSFAGDEALVKNHNFKTNIEDGFNFAARAALSVQLNLDGWRSEVIASQSMISMTRVSTFALGLSRDLEAL